MSGSVVDNAATVAAVRGSGFNPIIKPEEAVDVFTKWQDLSNKQATQKQIQATTANTEQTTIGQKQDQSIKGYDNAMQRLSALLNLPPDQRGPASYALVDSGLKDGTIPTQAIADTVKSQLPPIGSDPELFTRNIVSHLIGLQSAKDQIAGMQPNVSYHDVGNTTQIMASPSANQNAMNGGQVTPPVQVGSMQNTAKPENLNDIVTATDMNPNSPTYKQDIQMPRSQALYQMGVRPGGPAGQLPPLNSGGNNLNNGQGGNSGGNPISPVMSNGQPVSATNPPRLNPGGQNPTQANPYGTGRPSGYGKDAQKGVDQSVADFATDSKFHQQFPELDSTYENLRADLENAKTGKGTQFIQDVQSLIKTQSPELLKQLGIDPNTITDLDAAKKGFARLAAIKGSGGTDMQSTLNQLANGSTELDWTAVKGIINYNQGVDRMKEAAFQDFLAKGGNAARAGDWQDSYNKFASKYEPRGFMARQMMIDDPTRTEAMIRKMKPEQLKKFNDARILSDKLFQGQ